MAKDKHKETPEFSSILDTPSADVTRPKPAPVGNYLALVRGLPRIDKSTKKGTEFSEYTLQILEADTDVDKEALEEYLTKGDGSVANLRDRTLRFTLWHTEDSKWRMKQFFDHLGIDEYDEKDNKLTLGERMQMAPGRQIWVHVKHTPSDDGETMFANIDKTAPVEE